MATTAAAEHATLADQRVKVKDLPKLASGHGRYTSDRLHAEYPFVAKATFDAIKTRMNS